MSLWSTIAGLIGGGAARRQKGLQLESPYYASRSAAVVTVDTALQQSAVWACTRLISESIASLPIIISKVDPRTGIETPMPDHQLSILFNGRVNRWQTKQEFLETLCFQLVLLGNSYVAVQRDARNKIISLVPLMTEQMRVELDESGEIIYKYTDGANLKVYSQATLWHNKLIGNGIIGLSPLAYARNTVGIGIAAESATTKIFQDGGKPSGVLTIDQQLSPDHRARIKQNYAEMASGNENRLFVLEADMKFQQISLSPQDVELLSSRRFTVEEICRYFLVPSVLINDSSQSTAWGSGITQLVNGFYKSGLRPYLTRLEESMKVWLLPVEERATTRITFDTSDLLRPDQFERIKIYKEAVQGGILTPDEARAWEGWIGKPGGDSLYMQAQMVKLDDPNRGVSAPKQPSQ